MSGLLPLLSVAAGGAVGASLRYIWAGLIQRIGPENFPIGILSVNILGSFLMGVMIELLARQFNSNQLLTMFITTGILGGFTTFSAFSLEAMLLFERGHLVYAALYVLSSVAFSLLGIFAGLHLMRWVFA